jgi:hypothetical protein
MTLMFAGWRLRFASARREGLASLLSLIERPTSGYSGRSPCLSTYLGRRHEGETDILDILLEEELRQKMPCLRHLKAANHLSNYSPGSLELHANAPQNELVYDNFQTCFSFKETPARSRISCSLSQIMGQASLG